METGLYPQPGPSKQPLNVQSSVSIGSNVPDIQYTNRPTSNYVLSGTLNSALLLRVYYLVYYYYLFITCTCITCRITCVSPVCITCVLLVYYLCITCHITCVSPVCITCVLLVYYLYYLCV